MTDTEIEQCIEAGRLAVQRILAAPKFSFATLTPAQLPDRPGAYVISDRATGQVLRAGRTTGQTLRERIYRNHLMGNQKGNLRQQLVTNNVCPDLDSAKEWIRQHCAVQVLTEDQLPDDIRWTEHFLLAVLRPRFCD